MKIRAVHYALLTVVTAGCATTPVPQALDQALERIERVETAALAADRPELIQDARDYAERSKVAHEDDEVDFSELYAQMSLQSYDTATHLAAREKAQTSLIMLAKRDDALIAEQTDLKKKLREVERMQGLEAQIASLQNQIATADANTKTAAANAKRAVLSARNKQAAAIHSGAPTSGARSYQEGRALLETAVESMRLELFAESIATAERAEAVFARSILEAAQSETEGQAKARALAAKNAQDETRKETERKARADARRAFDAAAAAETKAIEAGVSVNQPAIYASAVRQMRAAERAYADGDYAEATRLANTVASRFEGQLAVVPASDAAQTAVDRAEDARAQAIVSDSTHERLPEADYQLQLARTALSNGRGDRAIAKAKAAIEIYVAISKAEKATTRPESQSAPRAAEGSAPVRAQVAPASPEAVVPAPAPAASTAPATVSTTALVAQPRAADGLAKAVSARMLELELARAEALGQSVDNRCPALFKEADALKLIAAKIQGSDPAQAFELLVRSSERLKQCRSVDASLPVVTSAAETNTAPSDKARAEAALQKLEVAQLSIAPRLGAKRMKTAQELIARAEKWYERGAYTQVLNLTKVAEDALAAAAKDQAAEERSKKVQAAKTAQQERARAEAAAAAEFNKARTLATTSIRASQEALAKVSVYAQAPQIQEAKALLVSAERWFERGAYTEASALAKRATARLKGFKPPKKTPQAPTVKPTVAQKVEVPSKKSDPRVDAQITEAIADAKLMLGEVRAGEPDSNRLARRMVSESELARAKGDAERARRLAQQALRVITTAPAKKEAETATTTKVAVAVEPKAEPVAKLKSADDSAWRLAYAKVIDARIMGDRAHALVGDVGLEDADHYMTQAKLAWEAKDFVAADRFADAAHREYRKALQTNRKKAEERAANATSNARPAPQPAPPALVPQPPNVTARLAPTPAAPAPTPVAAPVAPTPAPVVVQVKTPGPIVPSAGRDWSPAYSEVTEALIARDRAEVVATDMDGDRMSLGRKFLGRARQAWSAQNYLGAERLARAAREEFKGVLTAATARRKKAKLQDAELKAAQAKQRAAETSDSKATEATEAGGAPTPKPESAESKEKVDSVPPKNETAAPKVLSASPSSPNESVSSDGPTADEQVEAARALSTARAAIALCEQRKCESRDLDAYVAAKGLMGAARARLEANDAVAAAKLATQVSDRLKPLLSTPPKVEAAKQEAPAPRFSIAESITRVSRAGAALHLSPRVTFASGKSDIAQASLRSIDELALVLKANSAMLQKVRIIGHTDNRGPRAANLRISAQRAEAVAKALVARGVDVGLVESAGHGPDQPIDTNDTRAGREVNRRVEVRFELQPKTGRTATNG